MKKEFTFFIFVILAVSLQAQLINNKGNRLQTYPKVTEKNPQVKSYLNQVSIDSLENYIRWMQNLGCRDAQSQEAVQTQNWLVEKYESLGLDVYIQLFPCENAVYLEGTCTIEPCDGDTLQAGNVVAIQYGTEFPDEFIVLSCHYDHPDGPGADDNASGTAGVLECARILSQYSFKRSIMYVSFNAEEYWEVGSFPFVEKCARENKNIIGCFNLDMLGFFPEEKGNLGMFAGYSHVSELLFEYYSMVANLYVEDIPTNSFTLNRASGDAQPFNVYEYPALYIGDVEYKDLHPCYHKDCDTLGHGVNSMELVKAYTQASLAATVELANGQLPPQNFSAIQNQTTILLSWNSSNAVTYKIYKNDNFLIETTDTFFVDRSVDNGSKYKYYVIGFDRAKNEIGVSNTDEIIFSNSLILPYFNDFEEGFAEWNVSNQNWEKSPEKYSGRYSLTNGRNTNKQAGVFSFAELNWFSIPDTVENVSVGFFLKGIVKGASYKNKWAKTNNMFLEITTDRKRWNKLLRMEGDFNKWQEYNLSLNNYIGEPFVQIRIRIESLDYGSIPIPSYVCVDDFKVDFTKGDDVSIEETRERGIESIKIYPNPSTGIVKINSDINTHCKIEVYNVMGNKVFHEDNYNGRNINLSHLPKGMYFVKISTGKSSIAKRIIIH